MLVAFGAGAQIEAHIRLLLRTYKTIRECVIVNRNLNQRLERLRETSEASFPEVRFKVEELDQGPALEKTVSSADIICTATPSREPLFQAKWVKSGAHINLVGSYTLDMMEVDDTLIRRCNRVVVDSREACMVEAGELLRANLSREDLIEMGEIVDKEGREKKDMLKAIHAAGDITIFKSVGIGLQDTAIAGLVFEKAREMGIGVRLDSFHSNA